MGQKYRKKPVEVHAHQWDGDGQALDKWLEQFDEEMKYVREDDGTSIFIMTKEGTMRASPGNYIIRGVHGEFYPCEASIFKKTYELVENDN